MYISAKYGNIRAGGFTMCGRFYIDEEMAQEISRVIKDIDMRVNGYKEIYPTNTAAIIKTEGGNMIIDNPSWGFSHFDPAKKKVLFNARSETVLEKRMFKDSVVNRRCVIPAAGFYEWDKVKNKIAFTANNSRALYLAGFWREDRFVILTTAANDSIADVHGRMPLILEPGELENWLFDPEAYKLILQNIPGKLSRKKTDPEQLKLF